MQPYVRFSVLLFLFLVGGAIGCSPTVQSVEPISIASIRPSPAGIETIALHVSKDELARALETGRGAANVRIVPLVTSAAQAPASPEYRVFNVRPGSVAAIIGLKNADVLVAAHDYVVQSTQQFYNYLQLLRMQEHSSIEIRRDGKPIRIEVTFLS
jgi:S1-C subfamily serine protease